MSDASRVFLVRVQPMLPSHVHAVAALASDVPTAPHWPEAEFARLAELSTAAEPHTPHGRARGAWVAMESQQQVVGFAVAHAVAGDAELEFIVVAPVHRRQGAGALLLMQAMQWASQMGAATLMLECRVSNSAAIRLYMRHGFLRQGTRVGYYSNPPEDALLMALPLNNTPD